MNGLKLAALYGFYPHKLGFCGPEEKSTKKILLDYISGKKISERKIRKILKNFEAAHSYYKLIAKSNKIKDPFNREVVKAYWIGNKLLDKIKIGDLRQMVAEDFSKPGLLPKEIALKKAQEIPKNSKAHHSFHVLIIGSVTGRIVLEGKLLDICRIGWGKVINMEKDKIKVKYQPLVGKKKLILGKPAEKEIIWDKVFAPKIKIGDWITFHWNHIAEKIGKEGEKNLEKYTKINLTELAKIKR